MISILDIEHIALARKSIEYFSIEENEYSNVTSDSIYKIDIGVQKKNYIYTKSKHKAIININFNKANNCKIFLGNNIMGYINISFDGNDSIVYIGDNARLNKLEIRSQQKNDFIAIGANVTVTSSNMFFSGSGSGSTNPAIIIGDDCMFSRNVIIRNSDSHPIFDCNSNRQVNEPNGSVHIEPHVWVGEQVNILKSLTVGACSIVALASTVTKDVPRFSVAKGVPAVSSLNERNYWSRNYSKQAIDKAKYYTKKYKKV